MNGIETTPGLFGWIPEGQLYLLVQTLYGFAGVAYVGYLVARRSLALGQTATALFGTAIGFHALLLLTRGFQAGHPPWMNFYEAVMSVAFVTAATYFVLERFTGLRVLGPFATALVFLLLVHGVTMPIEFRGTNLMPALRDTYWRAIHVPTGMIAYGAFFISFLATTLYVWKRYLPNSSWLPDEDALDTAIYRTIGFAYPFQFLLLITGAAWANEAWGRWWGWDQKETWAFVTFMVYTLYLHVRLMRGSKGWAAGLSMLGALSVAITFWGVSFLPAIASKFHSYAAPQGTGNAATEEAPPDGQPPLGTELPEGHPSIEDLLPPGHPPIGDDPAPADTSS